MLEEGFLVSVVLKVVVAPTTLATLADDCFILLYRCLFASFTMKVGPAASCTSKCHQEKQVAGARSGVIEYRHVSSRQNFTFGSAGFRTQETLAL